MAVPSTTRSSDSSPSSPKRSVSGVTVPSNSQSSARLEISSSTSSSSCVDVAIIRLALRFTECCGDHQVILAVGVDCDALAGQTGKGLRQLAGEAHADGAGGG